MAFLTLDELVDIFLPILAYWIYSGLYEILGSFHENHKLHSKKDEEAKNLVSKKTVITVVLLQQIYQATLTFVLLKVTGGNDTSVQPSSLIVIARQFVVAMLVLDTYQYFMHRYMHHNKFLYRNFHSYHHRLIVPYAFGAIYGHPVDWFLIDTMGGALATILSGMSPRTSTFFFCFSNIKGVDDHCGMLLPGNPFHILFRNNTAFHDFHHQLHGTKYNFETPFFVMWDRIMGTYMPYSVEKRAGGGFETRPVKEFKDD
ncbi:hypothetical protein DITRI_Ditri17bG0126200 [Diplodiscus trichospermus]